jgi:uncharacterized protein YbcC (UPF0753/DUF2309 family)
VSAADSAHRPHHDADLRHTIEHVGHHLPGQAPLSKFVHHNTLHGDQTAPFREAVAAAHARTGARGWPDEASMRRLLRIGRIDEDDLRETFAELLGDAARARVGDHPESPTRLACLRVAMKHDVDPVEPHRVRYELHHGLARALSPHLDDRERARLRRGRDDAPTAEALWRAVCEVFSVPTEFPHPEDALSTARRHADAGSGVFRERVIAARALVLGGVGRTHSHLDAWSLVTGVESDPVVHDLLVRRLLSYLDEGLAAYAPGGRDRGLWGWFRETEQADVGLDPAWFGSLRGLLRELPSDPYAAVEACLLRLGVPADRRAGDLERTALRLPGWAGMAAWHDANPKHAGQTIRPYDLTSFLAVRLAIELAALEPVAARLGLPPHLDALARWAQDQPESLVVRVALSRGEVPPSLEDDARALVRTDVTEVAAWRELGSAVVAWWVSLGGERTLHGDARPLYLAAQHLGLDGDAIRRLGPAGAGAIVDTLKSFGPEARGPLWLDAFERHYRDQVLHGLRCNRGRFGPRTARPDVQVVTCIDDREEAFRRYLEELVPGCETFGVAGFFGVPMRYLGVGDTVPTPLCPVVQDPPFLVVEVPAAPVAPPTFKDRWLERVGIRPPVRARTRLEFQATASDPTRSPEAPQRGFTDVEQADRVANLLRQIGLTSGFSRLVVLFAHGGTTRNNPHFAAYECGACSGRRGGPNARVFATIANRPEVRSILAERGIEVPPDTRFVGAEHDTTSEILSYFDVEDLPEAHRAELNGFREAFEEAVARSAQERARKFASAPKDPDLTAALAHSRGRSSDFRQTRPELGHATNASCVVGRRLLTRGLFLDRRAFLVSYDPTIDPDGAVLEGILLAVGPVGAGINLEYYFSTVDPEKFGCGTKVAHNLASMIGVMAGGRGDLRTGLPRQMTEVHEPMRLLLIVEHTNEVLGKIHGRQPALRELIDGEWLQLVGLDPETGAMSRFRPGVGFVPWNREMAPIPACGGSYEAFRGRGDGGIDPVLLGDEVAHG